ncbi:putative CTD kinase, partial [Triangularia setosa]
SRAAPAMDQSSAQRRRRNFGPPPNGSHRLLERQHIHPRVEHDLGMTTSRRPTSPAAAAVNRSLAPARERDRDRDRKHHRQPPSPLPSLPPPPPPPPPRGRSPQPSKSDYPHRRRDRSRSTDYHPSRSSRPSQRSPHSHRDRSRERDRDREPARSRDRQLPPDRHRSRERSPRPRKDGRDRQDSRSRRRASRSPASVKRPRSPSPSIGGGSQPKKSRRDRSPGRVEKDAPKSLPPKPPRRDPSPAPRTRRSRSPEGRDHRRSKTSKRPARSRSPSVSRRRRSRSRGAETTTSQSARRRSRSPGTRQRSPRADHRRRSGSRSRPRSPAARGTKGGHSIDSGPHRRPSFDLNSTRTPRGPFPPGSPRDSQAANPTKNEVNADEPNKASGKFDPSSGSNSIEVNMVTRGNYRGGFNPQQQNYPSRGGYGQSSGQGTPASSFHGSPPAQSPYAGSGRGWNGPQHFSPPGSQYSQPYSHSNYGPPTGPQNHYHSNQSQTPPYAPTGPASQYPTGSYRGGHRGGSGGFRGGAFGGGRGVPRGGFKSAQWNPPHTDGRTMEPSHTSNHQSPEAHDKSEAKDVLMQDVDSPFRPPKELQVEDTNKEDKPKDDKMAPPTSRPPPTGPQSQTPNKFSFSMKTASKPLVAVPRPEISSKFNAPAAPREPAAASNPLQRAPPTKPERDRERDHRDRSGYPRNAPTEPASARSRPNDHRRSHDLPSRQPDPTPKTRKVKKIMKRLKEKPKLPEDLARSKSVFFRKPGNESVVGSGTYGKVFKGVNVYTKKLVALKRIRMEGERDGFPVTAVREIKLLRSLKHTNVVELQEVMVESNECFMVFEYLSHDLTGLLNHPNYTLEPAHKKHLAKQLFEGLDYLHTRGVLHRDIKAANILVSNEGVLKLADFGLARFYAKHHQLDYTNRVITIWYRSPELLLGETQYSPAVDIWSAACVLVEIFTKRAIFPGDGSEINQLDKIHSVLGTPTRSDWPDIVEMPWFELLRPTVRQASQFEEKYKDQVTPMAYDLLKSMFQYDPKKRPSAGEVLAHGYFTEEEPPARQAIELKDVQGDWHEFESKALRREKEKKEREEKDRKEREKKGAASRPTKEGEKERTDRKRPIESSAAGDVAQREAKRPHVEASGSSSSKPRGENR